MKIFSPEHPPVECTVQGSPSPRKELGATNGLGIVRLVRGKRSMQTEMGAYHPGKRRTFLRKISGSARPGFILILGLLALLVSSLSATSQMTGDLELAVNLHKAGKLQDAIEFYTEAIRKNPKAAEAYNWRGIAYDDLGETDKALQDFNAAIEISINYADAYNNRGEIHRKKKMYREALSDYSKAVQLEPNFAEAYYNVGIVSEAENRPGPAAANYENYLKNKPDAPDKSEIESKIKTLRQAAPSTQRPGSSAVAQKPGESTPAQPQAAPKPTPPGAAKPAIPPKPMTPNMPSIPGMPGVPIEMLSGLMTGMGILGAILPILLYLFTSFMLFFIARKTNTNLPWLAFIPIANLILMINIAGKPLKWLLLFLVPILAPFVGLLAPMDPTGGILMGCLMVVLILVPIVAWLFVSLGIARARGKSAVWGILLFLPCTNIIALAYLGLSD